MKLANYLYPYDLQVTPTPIDKILLIGSCLTGLYSKFFKGLNPGLPFDRILFNGIADVPDEPPLRMSEYGLQYIQLPIGSILGDGVIRATNFVGPISSKGIYEKATVAVGF